MNQLIKIGLGLAIAIVFPLIVGLGVEAFYPSPKNAYEKCQPVVEKVVVTDTVKATPAQEPDQKCLVDQEKVVNTYNRNVFIIVVIIGFIAIAAGTLYFTESIGPVGPGLVFGGLLTIVYGTQRGFTAVDKSWLFIELLILLVGLIAI